MDTCPINQGYSVSNHKVYYDKDTKEIIVEHKTTGDKCSRSIEDGGVGVIVENGNFYFKTTYGGTDTFERKISNLSGSETNLYFQEGYDINGDSSEVFYGCDDLRYGRVQAHAYDIHDYQVDIEHNGSEIVMTAQQTDENESYDKSYSELDLHKSLFQS